MDGHGQDLNSPKILIVGTEALHLRLPLMQRLQGYGFRTSAAGALEQPEFDDTPFAYHQYPVCRTTSPRNFRRSITALKEVMVRDQPDLVHAVNTKPCLTAPQAARQVGIPCVRTITGLGSVFSSDSLLYRGMQFAFRQMQKRVAADVELTAFQNPDDRDYFVERRLVPEETTRLIYGSGIDVEEIRGRVSSPKRLDELRAELNLHGKTVVTMVSRLMKVKGVEELTRAAAIIRKKFPDTVFLLVGPLVDSGPLSLSRSVIEDCDDVVWTGPRSDVPDLLAVSDIFTLPSYLREGIPRVLFEASAFKLPIVTTDMPGCRETVREGWNGHIIPPRDVDALVTALLPIIESVELRRRMGENSLQLVKERFELSIVARQYAELYSEALKLEQPQRVARAA